MDKLKVAVYCRVSTENQETSFINQQSYFTDLIDKDENCELVEIYADEGLTGTKLNNRPKFNKMLEDAGINIFETYTGTDKRASKKHTIYEVNDKEPLFNEIWMKNTSRLARNTFSFEFIQLLRKKNVHIKFVEQNINTKDVSSDFLLKLFQIFDEQESKDKSLKVITGIKESSRKGNLSTNKTIFGYKLIKEERRLEIIEEEAEIIRKIFDLYISGEGIRRILKYLRENNITTRLGKEFSKSTISRILLNEKYCGTLARNKYDTGIVFQKNSYAKIRPQEEWVIHEDVLPAIISKEIFNKCQEIRNSKVNHIKAVGVNKGYSEFSDLLYCSRCKSKYTSNIDRGRRFYNCSKKRKYGVVEGCNNPNISSELLEEKIKQYMETDYKKLICDWKEASIGHLIEYKTILFDKIDKNNEIEIENKTNEVLELETELEKYAIAYAKNTIKETLFEKLAGEVQSKIDILNNSIDKLSLTKNEILDNINEVEEAVSEINELEIKDSYSREEIIGDINSISIGYQNKDKNIGILFKLQIKIAEILNNYKIDGIN